MPASHLDKHSLYYVIVVVSIRRRAQTKEEEVSILRIEQARRGLARFTPVAAASPLVRPRTAAALLSGRGGQARQGSDGQPGQSHWASRLVDAVVQTRRKHRSQARPASLSVPSCSGLGVVVVKKKGFCSRYLLLARRARRCVAFLSSWATTPPISSPPLPLPFNTNTQSSHLPLGLSVWAVVCL